MGSCSSKSTGAEHQNANGQKQSPPTSAASPKTDKAPVQAKEKVNKEKGGKVGSADSVSSVSWNFYIMGSFHATGCLSCVTARSVNCLGSFAFRLLVFTKGLIMLLCLSRFAVWMGDQWFILMRTPSKLEYHIFCHVSSSWCCWIGWSELLVGLLKKREGIIRFIAIALSKSLLLSGQWKTIDVFIISYEEGIF